MKRYYGLLWLFSAMAMANASRPDDFVNLASLIPQAQYDIRYFSANNFVGRPVKGYLAPVCLLTRPAAQALEQVEQKLLPMGLTLKLYDCYRPQTAVNDFARWAKDLRDTRMKSDFYPQVDKSRLFTDGYIDYHSGHSRGSTVDLTIVPLASSAPDSSLDFGSGFDYFGPQSHPDYPHISPQARANRLLLQLLMTQAGFKPLNTEWWHFTLVDEPYPHTAFDFPVSRQALVIPAQ